ncbi:MAG TPA: biotin/lipoyl-containing protein [Solirubrobacteraceae bacterium]|nr:biotin/lipoyl-containing protein [Solirubrobacteraceae bacterium]
MTVEANVRVFNLPDVGEGLVEARVVEVLVSEGQAVKRFDTIVEVDTDKSTVELSAPWAGTVRKIHVEVGDYVEVGKPVLEIELAADEEGEAS